VKRLAQILACGLCTACVMSGSGCMAYLHPVGPPRPEQMEPCQAVPKYSRDHVYVFFVDGMDPLNFANLSGVCEYVQALGFNKTYWGQLFHTPVYTKKIREIQQQDPEAHFVLIGFSFGANAIRDIANEVRKDNIFVDLLVYLGGNTLENSPRDQPDNVGHIINILATGWIWNGADMDRAENLSVPDVWHFGSPTHRETLKVLAQNLAVIAETIPVPDPGAPPSMRPAGEEEPTPLPLMNMKRASNKAPEWEFLHPCSRLKMPPPLETKPNDPKTVPPVAADRIASR
jgi:hypothetical protein